MKTKLKNGFTLIEVLVVIGIIAIVVAILTPVLAHSRADARRARCVANMKQLGVLFSVYAGEHNGCMPMARLDYLDAQGKAKTDVWFRYLYPYVNDSLNDRDHPYMTCPAWSPTEPYPYSYAMERSAGSDTLTFTGKITRLMDLQQNVHNGAPVNGRRWLLLDGGWYFLDAVKGLNDLSGLHKTPVFRHRERLNVLFPDSSIQSLTRQEVNSTLYLFKERPIP